MSEKLIINEKMFEKLPDNEKNSEFIAMESKTFIKDVKIN